MFFAPQERDRKLLPHDPFKAIVAPRPIGWISSLSSDGLANLAPYSFFNAVGGMPPMVMFASEGIKDSVRNAADTGEFVCNYVSKHLESEMNATSVAAPSGISEFEYCGIAPASCHVVAAPRVANACAALECKVTSIIETVDVEGVKTGAVVVMGQVMGVHLDEAVLRDGRFDISLADPVTRLGYLDFAGSHDLHEMPRPNWGE